MSKLQSRNDVRLKQAGSSGTERGLPGAREIAGHEGASEAL